jgi:serine---pyruvate transaminase
VAAGERAVARSAALGPGGFYLDWERTRKGGSRSPFTPPVTLVCQLQEALRLIEAEGLQDVFARHRALGRMCRAGVQACGVSLLGRENPEANVVTAFLVPEGVDGKAIPAGLKSRFGITIAGGQGKLSGRICRIGHCGYYDYRDILTTLGALEIVLADLGHPVEIGAGVAAAQRVAADALTPS